MSEEWSKDQVLQAYLNIIYFGRGAYGISAASKAYFNKPVEQLTVADGALLGGADPAAVDAGPRGRSRGCRRRGGTGCSTAWWRWARCRREDLRHNRYSRRPCRRSGARGKPDQRPQRADRAPGDQGTARPVQHRRADAEHPGVAGHHHHRPAGPAGRGGRGVEIPRRPGCRRCGRRWCRSTRTTGP